MQNDSRNKSWHISRRTALRGVSTAMALPLLDAMIPTTAIAQSRFNPTVRMGLVFFPNGAVMDDWNPRQSASGFELGAGMGALSPYQNDLLFLGGLTSDKARANGDGPGDHARNSAAFLTATQPVKTNGSNIRAGVSIDQVAAEAIGENSRLPSFELGTDAGRNVGNCDSGYSCAYSSNISWKTPNTPMAKEVNPRLAFERLFGTSENPSVKRRQAQRDPLKRSILDVVAEDAKRLQLQLGAADKRKLEEYFTSVRDIERRIVMAESQTESDWQPDYRKPDGIPSDFGEHARLMYDMMVLAFQGDVTRISTFMLARAGSNRNYRAIGVSEGHHEMSHHAGDQSKINKVRQIDRFHTALFAYFLKRLSDVKEGNGTLLDNCMIMYGSGIADGNRHNHEDLPILLAGKGAGTVQTGRYLTYPRNTPLANLYIDMLDRMGVQTPAFGDATGRLGNIGRV